MQSLALLGGTQHVNKEQQAGLIIWETSVKCQETFLCCGVGEEVIKHWIGTQSSSESPSLEIPGNILKKLPLAGSALSRDLDQRHPTSSTNTSRTSCSVGVVRLHVPASNSVLLQDGLAVTWASTRAN